MSCAVALADAKGIDAVTMRSLAEALGVSAMSLYAHVSDKDDILDAVIQARLVPTRFHVELNEDVGG